jgi:hypothetical protein
MGDLLERHGLNEDDPTILAALMPPAQGTSAEGSPPDELPAETVALFTPHGGGESFRTDVGLKDTKGGEERHYDLSLWRVRAEAGLQENESPVCVMLILNVVTQLTQA